MFFAQALHSTLMMFPAENTKEDREIMRFRNIYYAYILVFQNGRRLVDLDNLRSFRKDNSNQEILEYRGSI